MRSEKVRPTPETLPLIVSAIDGIDPEKIELDPDNEEMLDFVPSNICF